MDEATVVALRTGDPELADRVRALAELVGTELVVHPPQAPPPRARLLLEDTAGGAPWAEGVHRLAVGPAGPPGALLLPRDDERLLELLVAGPARARVVGFLGAHGGVGTTTLACVLARAAVTAGTATCLLGLDPAGGPDGVLGLAPVPGPRWADLGREDGAHVPARLLAALPRWRGVAVLTGDDRGGPAPELALAAVDALTQACDLLVLDLPRHALQVPALLRRCEHVVLVSGCDERATEAVATARGLRAQGHAPRLVVRRRRAPQTDVVRLAEACGVPVTAVLREERSLGSALARGLTPGDQGRGPLLSTARSLLRSLEVTR